MPTPSLLIVPARFKTGKLYSQIPTSGAGDFTVTRNTEARRFGPDGLIASVASGIPRLDYYTSGGVTGCPALLVEPSGTNLYQQSEDFSNVYWNRINCVVSGNLTIAPDGNLTADKLIMNSGISPSIGGQSGINRTETITSGTYRFSVFAKAAEFTGFRVRENALQGTFLDVNLTNGAITNGDVTQFINPLAENYGNGWYRISWTSPTTTSLTKYSIRVGSTGDGVSGIFIWGAQVETASVATSYIPTTTGTGSRSADVVSVSGAVSGSIGQQSGTIYCEFEFNTPTVSTAGLLSVESTNDQNRILLWHNSTNNALGVQLKANNSNVFNTSIGTLTNGQIYKIAIGYSSGNTKVYLNGNSTAVITNTSAYTMAAALSRICLGNYENSASLVTISRIRSFALYAERLTDAEMIALTTP